jgi:hypothetical protein
VTSRAAPKLDHDAISQSEILSRRSGKTTRDQIEYPAMRAHLDGYELRKYHKDILFEESFATMLVRPRADVYSTQ